jgi:hypothetical protein
VEQDHDRLRHRVGDVDELRLDFLAHFEPFVDVMGDELAPCEALLFVEHLSHELNREWRRVDVAVESVREEWNCADVVEVCVRQEDALDVLFLVAEDVHIRRCADLDEFPS